MFLCVLGLTVIGGLLAFVIPEGPAGGGSAKYFLGVHRHQWGNIHLDLSLAFAAFLIIHIVLGWSWIRGKARKVFGKAWKPALAATVFAAALVPVLFWGVAAKNDPAYADYGTGAGRRGGCRDKRNTVLSRAENPRPRKTPAGLLLLPQRRRRRENFRTRRSTRPNPSTGGSPRSPWRPSSPVRRLSGTSSGKPEFPRPTSPQSWGFLGTSPRPNRSAGCAGASASPWRMSGRPSRPPSKKRLEGAHRRPFRKRSFFPRGRSERILDRKNLLGYTPY